MISSTRLGRRRLLRLLVTAAGLPLAGLIPFHRRSAAVSEDAAALAETFGGLFRNPKSVRAIGRAYLARQPRQGPSDLLPEQRFADLCAERGANLPALCRSGRDEISAWLDAAVRQDFAEGRMVDLDGWQLAETEAMLCAAVASRQDVT